MKGKKLCCVLLSAVTAAGLLTGLGSTAVLADEPYNIDMQIVTWGTAPDEIADVEAAINAIIEPEIGATVTLNPIAAWDLINESNMAITSGEKVDLMCVYTFNQGMDSLANYTSKNMLRPLNELFDEYAPDAKECLGEEISLGYIGDTLYAVPSKSAYGLGNSFLARKDYLDELGIHPEPDKYYTMDDLAEIFQAYVDKYGAGHYPIALFGAGMDIYADFSPLDTLGGTGVNGVLMNAGLDGNTTVVDLFETDEYMEYCKAVHEWFQNGYINPDVNTIADDVTSQLKSGNYLGSFGTSNPGSAVGMQNSVGVEFELFPIVEPYASTTAASTALWTIPVTCENPEKTMEFLNLLYQERDHENDVHTLLALGLEGVSYEMVEQLEGSKAIVSPGTGNWTTMVPNDLYGDMFTLPRLTPNDASIYDEWDAFNQAILDSGRITDAFGYVFDPYNVSSQVAAVTNVNSQYRGLVGYGAADPEEVLPEFIAALKDAGIDDIIAENQRQLDEWYASKAE